jgi:hypothetical protein
MRTLSNLLKMKSNEIESLKTQIDIYLKNKGNQNPETEKNFASLVSQMSSYLYMSNLVTTDIELSFYIGISQDFFNRIQKKYNFSRYTNYIIVPHETRYEEEDEKELDSLDLSEKELEFLKNWDNFCKKDYPYKSLEEIYLEEINNSNSESKNNKIIEHSINDNFYKFNDSENKDGLPIKMTSNLEKITYKYIYKDENISKYFLINSYILYDFLEFIKVHNLREEEALSEALYRYINYH